MVQDTVFSGHDAHVLPARFWPAQDETAALLVVHGLGEHSGRYNGMAQALNEAGISVYAYDQRGHGANAGTRGYARLADLEKDVLAVLRQIQARTAVPVFLFGHSMGGGIALYTLLHSRPDVRSAVICSPWLIITRQIPAFAANFLKAHPAAFGHVCISNGIPATALCHDLDACAAYARDPLTHDRISLALAGDMLYAADYSLSHTTRLQVPLLLCHGEADGICSIEGSRRFAQACPKVQFTSFANAYHELHNEPCIRQQHFAGICKFIHENLHQNV